MEAYLVCKHRHKTGSGAIVLLDFKKAYDRVNRTWLWEVMEGMNFGPAFIDMIRTPHTDSTVSLSINSRLSDLIKVTGGVRQGCPIAPLLFAINTEPLRSLATSGSKHQGIVTLGIRSRAGMYADDTTGYVKDREDFLLFKGEINLYCDASGAQLNEGKSSIIFLGHSFECSPLQIIKKGEVDRLLGFMLGVEATDDIIHLPVIEKFELRCAQWSNVSLSLGGRVAMVRVFAESTIEYTAPFHTYSNTLMKDIKHAYWGAIYGKEKSTRQAFAKAVAHTSNGGLGAMDIIARLRAHLALWHPHAREKQEENWAALFLRSAASKPPSKTGDVVESSTAWWNEIKHTATKPEEERWRVKHMYKAMVSKPPAIIPSIAMPCGKSWNHVWRYLDQLPIPGKTGEIQWRNWLGKLKTARNGNSARKCICEESETSDHVANKCVTSA
jgi:hypothetical protein